jgi:hypothetical protein
MHACSVKLPEAMMQCCNSICHQILAVKYHVTVVELKGGVQFANRFCKLTSCFQGGGVDGLMFV